MSELRVPEIRRFRLLIVVLLIVSLAATVWSTLLMIRSAQINRHNSDSLLPLLERAEEFESEMLNARIAFIYHVTLAKPGGLEQGWGRYRSAKAALTSLNGLARENSRAALVEPQIEALNREWDTYAITLKSTLQLVAGGTRSGPAFDLQVAEWAAQGNALVSAARELVKTTVSLSRAQSNQTGDILHISSWIIAANGAICLLLTLSFILVMNRRMQPTGGIRQTARSFNLQRYALNFASLLTHAFQAVTGLRVSNIMLAGLSGMLLLIVVVLGTGCAALIGIATLSNAQRTTLHAQQAMLVAENLRSLTLVAESETRAYVFSGRPVLLGYRQTAMTQAWQQLDRLTAKCGSDPSHLVRLNRIHSALGQRFQNLSTISQIRQQYGAKAAGDTVVDLQRLKMREELRDAINGFESFEYQGIVNGTLRADRAAATSKTLILFAALPAAITLVLLSVVMTHLLSRSKQLQEQLTLQASHDILTGLPNRLALETRLSGLVGRAQREGSLCAVLGVDLDHFKSVNDRYGHQEGDIFLRTVASRLSSAIRAGDTLIRVGGDEFLCLAGGIRTPEDAELVAKKLLGSLADPIQLATASVKASISIGIAVFPHHGDHPEALTKHADDALYQAKEAGRNQFRCFEENEAKARLRLLEECLETALDRNLFHLVYQPQYTARGGLRGFEALLRLTHPTLGPISPLEFIPLVEHNGLIVPLGAWVLQQACATFAGWLAAGMQPGVLSLNVSAAQFAGASFHQTVAATLRACGLPPDRLELELTESTVMKDVQEATRQMSALAHSGVRLAIDDFGTGYSSLEHLNRLPLSTLKIDRGFVRQLTEGNTSRPIIEAIVALGKALRLEIVAEGVETEAQRGALSAIGCDHFQGFLFARPLLESAAAALAKTCHFTPPDTSPLHTSHAAALLV